MYVSMYVCISMGSSQKRFYNSLMGSHRKYIFYRKGLLERGEGINLFHENTTRAAYLNVAIHLSNVN